MFGLFKNKVDFETSLLKAERDFNKLDVNEVKDFILRMERAGLFDQISLYHVPGEDAPQPFPFDESQQMNTGKIKNGIEMFLALSIEKKTGLKIRDHSMEQTLLLNSCSRRSTDRFLQNYVAQL